MICFYNINIQNAVTFIVIVDLNIFLTKIPFLLSTCVDELLSISEKITINWVNPYFILATFQTCFFSKFQALMMKKLSHKYYNKRIATRDNGNVQSHDQEGSKLNSTINANSGAHTLSLD